MDPIFNYTPNLLGNKKFFFQPLQRSIYHYHLVRWEITKPIFSLFKNYKKKRILKIWKRFMILRIYQGLNTCNLLEYMHFSLFALSTLCSYRWMRYFPLSQIHIVDGDRWGCLWLFVCFLYFLGLLFWRCISLERDFRAVHILRNHFWGSERPPPPCDIVIIWAYTPITPHPTHPPWNTVII